MEKSGFTYEADNHVLVVHLPRELDHHNCQFLGAESDMILDQLYIRKMVFDFSKTRFMDSSGIGVLMGKYKEMRASGGNIAIYGTCPQVERVLQIAGLQKLIASYATKEEAIAG